MRTRTKHLIFALCLSAIAGFCVGTILVALIDATSSLEFSGSEYKYDTHGTFIYYIEEQAK